MRSAAIFHGLTPILVPQDQSLANIAGILTETRADALVAGAGAVPLKELLRKYPSLKQMIWVVERTSRHMDWNEVPEGEGGRAEIAVWHDIVDEKNSASRELPTELSGGSLPNVAMVIEDGMSALDSYEIVEYTQKVSNAAVDLALGLIVSAEFCGCHQRPDVSPPEKPSHRTFGPPHTPCSVD